MTAQTSLTVVIPAYRAERTIGRALDSVLTQPGVDDEIVVVIDGESDDTVQRLAQYLPEKLSIVLNPINQGAARARNQGLARASTEFVMFVDADDFVEGQFIGGLADVMRSTGADVAFGPMEILYEKEGRRAPRFVPNFSSPYDILRKWHLEGLYVNPTSVMWRTDFIRAIGGWDPEITRNDDGELVMRAVLTGAKIAVSGEGTGVYVKHSGETMNHRSDNLESMLRVNDKLLRLPSPWLLDEDRQEICGGHYFNVAWQCYLAGRPELGDQALAKARALGFEGYRGPRPYHILFALLGVRRTMALARHAKRILGRL